MALASILDQGLYSGSQFLLNILLARWLEPREYGGFAVAFAVLLFLSGLHNALLLEPMSVIGAGRYQGNLLAYVRAAMRLHFGLTCLIALPAILAGFFARDASLSRALIGAGFAAPAVLFVWLMRRVCYLRANPGLAVGGSAAYGVLLLVACPALRRLLRRREMAPGGPEPKPRIRELIRSHWVYAKWSTASTVAYWLASAVYLPLVGASEGLEAVAGYRAIENLLLPMGQVLTAMGLLLLPWAASVAADLEGLARLAMKAAMLSAALAALYALAVVGCGRFIIGLVYGSAYYTRFLPLALYLGAAVVLRAAGDTGFGMAARAAGRPDLVFCATLMAAGVTVSLGLGLILRAGALGAAQGWMLSSFGYSAVMVGLFLRLVKARGKVWA